MTFRLEQATVLVLDDDEFVVSTMAGMLERIGVERVVSTHDVEAGVHAINDLGGVVHAALVDFQMPKRHGLQFIKEIRTGRTEAPFNLPCLMLTSHVHARLLGLAMALNVDAFIEKPAKPGPLEEHLARVFSTQQELGTPHSFEKIDVEHSLEDLIQQISNPAELASEVIADVPGRSIDLSIEDPEIGNKLAADVTNSVGQVLLAAGTILDAGNIALLKNLMEFDPSVGTIWV